VGLPGHYLLGIRDDIRAARPWEFTPAIDTSVSVVGVIFCAPGRYNQQSNGRRKPDRASAKKKSGFFRKTGFLAKIRELTSGLTPAARRETIS
jgi:hypothetical protein